MYVVDLLGRGDPNFQQVVYEDINFLTCNLFKSSWKL